MPARAALNLSLFVERLGSATRVPILVARLPQLERVAWLQGRRVARRLERRALHAFARSVGSVLRSGDLLAHEPGSDLFAAALCATMRSARVPGAYGGGRTTVARIGAVLEASLQLDVQTGWTLYEPARDAHAMPALLQRALDHGAHERERFAFFAALGHELRTPLASIRGYLETLLEESPIEAHTRRRFTGVAYRETLRLSRLIDGLFDISMLDLDPAVGYAARTQLAHVFDAVRDATQNAARLHGTTVEAAATGGEWVAIDAERLTLVLVNLIENGIKHGRPGGRVCIETRRFDTFVRLSVDDDGPGVPDEDREHIFAFGVRGRTRTGGTGIGLALVRRLIERAGGSVEAGVSTLGGARFVVTLPRAQRDPSLAPSLANTCGVMKNKTSSLVCER